LVQRLRTLATWRWVAKVAAGKYNFTIEQGTTHVESWKVKDANGDIRDLSSGYKAYMHIRENVADETAVDELSSEGDGAEISLTSGAEDTANITLTIADTVTAAYAFDTAVYDLELVNTEADPNTTERVLQGVITLDKEVTRVADE